MGWAGRFRSPAHSLTPAPRVFVGALPLSLYCAGRWVVNAWSMEWWHGRSGPCCGLTLLHKLRALSPCDQGVRAWAILGGINSWRARGIRGGDTPLTLNPKPWTLTAAWWVGAAGGTRGIRGGACRRQHLRVACDHPRRKGAARSHAPPLPAPSCQVHPSNVCTWTLILSV